MKKLPVLHWFVFALLFFTATAAGQSSPVNGSVAKDDHSFAQPDKAVVTHLNLSIKVNFATHQLTGKAVWIIHNITKGDEIIFDDNGLNIQRITIGYPEKNTRWFLDTATTFMGRALHIKILPTTKKVTVYYTTSKDAVALQWLTPQQTTDKTKPYLFTQSYAIWARTWLPCQDMPGIRFTYTATVAVPRDLVAAMSAEGPITKTTNSIYHFKQAHPIPSYLMALAVGDIKFKAIDNRTGIYAEPTLLNKAAREFTDMGKMVTTAEALYGPYRWGRFDVLIAPPSFTLSGMENPNLVFLTPGLITGDRSLVSVVAHELAHSWSGNLVTNATWNDFWLNEGITTYFEHRIGEELYGHDEADMQAVLSRKSLRNDVAELGDSSADTHLKLNLSNRNPDEALTAIPYDKGYAFLQVIEQIAGRKKFDEFLESYFSAHAFQSHTTEQFLAALNQQLFNNDTAVENNIRENEWVYGGGIPANIIPVSSAKFMRIDSLLALTDLRKALPGLSQKVVSFNERYYFLGHLPAIVSTGDMAALDKEFSFTQSQNYRLLRLWLLLSIAHHYAPADSQLESYMTKYGASSYSLYAALIATSKGKVKAKQIFAKARSGYHPIEAKAIEELLK